MQSFRINKDFEVVCEASKTRNGFKHEATLLKNGEWHGSQKINYINRTWELYEFESVIHKLIDGTLSLTERQKKVAKNNIRKRANGETARKLNTIASIASLGEVFSSNKKGANEWKARMIKAGLGEQNIIMPEDWNELNEDDKEKRLNNVISELKN